MDRYNQHERTTAIEGEFDALPLDRPLLARQQRREIVCRRCGGKPRITSSRLADGPSFTMARCVAVPPVRDRIPAVVASGGQINLVSTMARAWKSTCRCPGRGRLLAHDLIGALLPPAQLGDDPALGQERFEERVARVLCHTGKGGEGRT